MCGTAFRYHDTGRSQPLIDASHTLTDLPSERTCSFLVMLASCALKQLVQRLGAVFPVMLLLQLLILSICQAAHAHDVLQTTFSTTQDEPSTGMFTLSSCLPPYSSNVTQHASHCTVGFSTSQIFTQISTTGQMPPFHLHATGMSPTRRRTGPGIGAPLIPSVIHPPGL